MSRIVNSDRKRGRNLPVAIIVAAGLAAGLGLARPAASNPAQPGAEPNPAPAADAAPGADGSYRSGNRAAGSRDGTTAEPVPAPVDEAAEAAITIEDFAYDGATSVPAGSTVTVTNRDGVAHTLSLRSDEADTGTIDGGATSTLSVPTAPGTYAYFCRIHPAMAGEIEITG